MSTTLLTAAEVPVYIKEVVRDLYLTNDYNESDTPGYTFKLYGKHRVGYERQLSSDCENLLTWCQRYFADAYIVSKHFWWTEVPVPGGSLCGDWSHKRKAYRDDYRNYIKIVITDPVAFRFEKDKFYRE